MPRYAAVRHEEWIAAPTDVVRAQFADLDHHIRAGVHPKLRFEVLGRDGGTVRYLQEVTLLGIRQRDVLERRLQPDGTIVDLVAGSGLIFEARGTPPLARDGGLFDVFAARVPA